MYIHICKLAKHPFIFFLSSPRSVSPTRTRISLTHFPFSLTWHSGAAKARSRARHWSLARQGRGGVEKENCIGGKKKRLIRPDWAIGHASIVHSGHHSQNVWTLGRGNRNGNLRRQQEKRARCALLFIQYGNTWIPCRAMPTHLVLASVAHGSWSWHFCVPYTCWGHCGSRPLMGCH